MIAPLEIWIAAFFTLAVFSFLFGENKIYRFAEHVYIGASAAIGLVAGTNYLKSNLIAPIGAGKLVLIIPAILGLLLYTRFSSKLTWLSRYPMALIMGFGTGMAMRGTIVAQFLSQIQGTIIPFNSLGNIVIVLGTTAVLLFFYFSRERTGFLKHYSTFGRWIMMVAFGATFGNAVMAQLALLIGRIQFLLQDWLHLLG